MPKRKVGEGGEVARVSDMEALQFCLAGETIEVNIDLLIETVDDERYDEDDD